MYAVIVAGGKQQRVAVDDVIRVEKIESADGHVEFDKVLAVADGANVKLGAPYVDGGKVTAEVVKQGRADKVTITKFRRRKHFQKVSVIVSGSLKSRSPALTLKF